MIGTNNHGDEDHQEESPSQELLNLIWDFSEGVITESNAARLNELLLESPANRETYAQFMQLISRLEQDRTETAPFDTDLYSSPSIVNTVTVIPDLSNVTGSRNRSAKLAERSSSFVAVTCAGIVIFVTGISILSFLPWSPQIVAVSGRDAKSIRAIEGQKSGSIVDDRFAAEGSILLQDQLDELVQMSSGGP